MVRAISRIAPVLLAASALSCAEPRYVYQPTTLTNAQVDGRVASLYQIPPESPQGDVRLTSFGIVRIRPPGTPENMFVRAVHVRMIVSDNSDVPWTVDTREQHLAMTGLGETRAAYTAVPAGTPPVIVVPPGDQRVVDLFFPLPNVVGEPKRLPAFDVIWRVQTGERVVAERTPFERMEIVPVHREPYGPWNSYYYDPLYPYGGFYGTAIPPSYTERPVIIEAPPAERVR